jgi:putative phosphoribosyl transferase
MMLFRNRVQAARLLARRLAVHYKNKRPVVLGIPRGAVPMAKVIADALRGDLDVVLVHKLSHPEQLELAIGAIDESGNSFLTDYAADLDSGYLESEKQRQLEALRDRRAQYTPLRPPVDPRGRTVIVVDDGIATGSTMIAALRAVRSKEPEQLVAAVAVASPEAARAIAQEADATFCLKVPSKFHAVGQFFVDFAQIEDEEVVSLLQQGKAPSSAAG